MKDNHLTPVLGLLAVSTALLGISMLLIGVTRHITLITDAYSISDLVPTSVFNAVAALSFIAISAISLVSIKKSDLRKILGYVLITVGIVPLLSLFSSSMWIDTLGGFPAIGAGQGVIKYFALVSAGILLLKPELSPCKKKLIAAFPVILVLLWIGGMKFTDIEAQGIKSLVSSSPLMFWMYKFWDVQTTSNLIGVYDLIAAALVLGAVFQPKLLIPSVAMSGVVFLVTQTFLFSVDGVWSMQTLLSTTGHFLIKDLWFIANLLFLWQMKEK